MSDLYDLMGSALRDHREEGDAIHDLWTWLPSQTLARAVHGDYASENALHRTSAIREAQVLLAIFHGFSLKSEDLDIVCPLELWEAAGEPEGTRTRWIISWLNEHIVFAKTAEFTVEEDG